MNTGSSELKTPVTGFLQHKAGFKIMNSCFLFKPAGLTGVQQVEDGLKVLSVSTDMDFSPWWYPRRYL